MGSRKKTPQEYQLLAREVHQNKYDYSLWNTYVPIHHKVTIICPLHGKFKQTIANHINGAQCPSCNAIKRTAGFNKKSINYFVDKATMIHQGKYDYSQWIHVQNSSKDRLPIKCTQHGVFYQTPASHIDKRIGCPTCSVVERTLKYSNQHGVIHPTQLHIGSATLSNLNSEVWLIDQHHTQQKSLLEIGNQLNVSDATVGRYLRKQNIRTKRHPRSIGEKEVIDFITALGINVDSSNRTVLYPQELDIYIPTHNLAIEYCGLYWHGEHHKPPSYHFDKLIKCQEHGIRLITMFEDEWKNQRLQCMIKISDALGIKSKTTPTEESIMFIQQKLHEYSVTVDPLTLVDTVIEAVDQFITSTPVNKLEVVTDLRWDSVQCYAARGFTPITPVGPEFMWTDGITRYDTFQRNPATLWKIYDCGKMVYYLNFDPSQ